MAYIYFDQNAQVTPMCFDRTNFKTRKWNNMVPMQAHSWNIRHKYAGFAIKG